MKLLTRRQIIDIWLNNKGDHLNKYCCPNCRDLLSLQEQSTVVNENGTEQHGVYVCGNNDCSQRGISLYVNEKTNEIEEFPIDYKKVNKLPLEQKRTLESSLIITEDLIKTWVSIPEENPFQSVKRKQLMSHDIKHRKFNKIMKTIFKAICNLGRKEKIE